MDWPLSRKWQASEDAEATAGKSKCVGNHFLGGHCKASSHALFKTSIVCHHTRRYESKQVSLY